MLLIGNSGTTIVNTDQVIRYDMYETRIVASTAYQGEVILYRNDDPIKTAIVFDWLFTHLGSHFDISKKADDIINDYYKKENK